MTLHLQGMWLAFAITVFFVVFFVNKIQKDMEEHQNTLAELETEKNRSERLASLATLAAGAAHEFSTPLATIAVAAGEMLADLNKQQADPDLIADTRLIRDQVERCREILYQMSADAGEHLAEALRVISVYDLFSEILSWFPDEIRRRIQAAVCRPGHGHPRAAAHPETDHPRPNQERPGCIGCSQPGGGFLPQGRIISRILKCGTRGPAWTKKP